MRGYGLSEKYKSGRPMLLTILTPTLNCAPTIGATLQSIIELEQKFPAQIQHLIGDGGSRDQTMKILEHHANQYPWIKCHALPGKNIPATLNFLLPLVKGQYVLVLNGDDHVVLDGMEKMLRRLVGSSIRGILCGFVSIESESGMRLGERRVKTDALESYMSVNHPAMLASADVFSVTGLYDEATPTAYDYIWTWTAFRKGIAFEVEPVIAAHVRLGGISQTRANRAAREILYCKIHAGCYLRPLRNHVLFHLKATIRRLSPLSVLQPIRDAYRRRTHSIDHY